MLAAAADDIVFKAPERRAEPRFKLIVPGRFVLPDGSEHRCVTDDASVSGYGIRASKRPRVGTTFDMELHHLGSMRVKVARHTEKGFGVEVLSTRMDKKSFGQTMIWLVKSQRGEVADGRKHERVVPERRDVFLSLADGRRIPAELADLSRSGAAIATGLRPPVGSVVLVGKTRARVVRHLAKGFGVEFLTVIPAGVDLSKSPDL